MKKFLLTLEMVLAVLYSPLCAQNIKTAILQGKVFDKETNEEISFVPIVLIQDGIQKAVSETNENGEYIIPEISAGTYDLKIVCRKYQPMIIKNISIDSSATELDVPMLKTTDKLEVIVVIADKFIRLMELAKELIELNKN